MTQSLHQQMERWVQIAILQRYISADQLEFQLEISSEGILSNKELQKKLGQLIRKTCKRFRLTPPGRKGKATEKLFRDWEKEMLVLFCCVNYDKMMCSVCPLSLGMEAMIQSGGAAPCCLLPDTKIYVFEPAGCPIIASKYWDESYLIQQIAQTKDHEVAANFLGISRIFHPPFFLK